MKINFVNINESDMDSLTQRVRGFKIRVFLLLDGLSTMTNELHLPNYYFGYSNQYPVQLQDTTGHVPTYVFR